MMKKLELGKPFADKIQDDLRFYLRGNIGRFIEHITVIAISIALGNASSKVVSILDDERYWFEQVIEKCR